MSKEKIYKIRKKNDGLFSKGGSRPSFDKRGKFWRSIGSVKLHLNHVREIRLPFRSEDRQEFMHPYVDCEIVTYALHKVEASHVMALVRGVAERKEKKKKAEEIRSVLANRKRLEAELARIEKELGRR